jgi:rhamnosyltransferase
LVTEVRALAAQFQGVVVADDGSGAGFDSVLADAEAAGAVVVRRDRNSGIAATLNAGAELALLRWRPDFLATFDQDSLPAANYLVRALDTYAGAVAEGIPVGFLVAATHGGRACRTRRSSHRFAIALDPLQSGFVIPQATWAAVGAFEEALVIDGVDSEFTERVRASGRQVLVAEGADLDHQLGRRDPGVILGRPVRFRGKQLSFNYHSPQRVYYIARNGAVLAGRYFLKDPSWVLLRSVEEAKAHLMRLAFSPDRAKLLRAVVSGLCDAFAGRLGPIPEQLARRLR